MGEWCEECRATGRQRQAGLYEFQDIQNYRTKSLVALTKD